MDRRIKVQKAKTVKKPSGQRVAEGWESFIPGTGEYIWAMKHSQSRAEGFQSDKKTATRNVVFVTRYYPEINESHTVFYEGKRYDITGIEEIGRREGLRLEATWTQGQYND